MARRLQCSAHGVSSTVFIYFSIYVELYDVYIFFCLCVYDGVRNISFVKEKRRNVSGDSSLSPQPVGAPTDSAVTWHTVITLSTPPSSHHHHHKASARGEGNCATSARRQLGRDTKTRRHSDAPTQRILPRELRGYSGRHGHGR